MRAPGRWAVRLATALGPFVGVAVIATVLLAGPAAAQLDGEAPGVGDYLSVADVTPTVAPDGTWRAELSLATDPPPAARVRSTVHQPLGARTARRRLAEILEGDAAGPSLQNPVTTPVETIRRGSSLVLELPIRPRAGDAARILVPNAGIHPVTVELLDADGRSLQSLVLFLNRLPDDPARSPLRVATLLSITSPPLIAADGTIALPTAGRDAVEHAVDLLGGAPAAPVTVDVDPQLLDEAARTGVSEDADLVDGLVEAIGRRPLLRRPWVPIHTESWAQAGAVAALRPAFEAGQLTFGRALGRRGDRSTWPLDPNLGPGSVELLRGLGVEHVVVRPEQLEEASGAVAAATDRRVHLGGVDSGLDALVVDPGVAERLSAPSASTAMSTHLGITELMAVWGALPSGETGAVVIDLTNLPTATATQLLAALAEADDAAIRVGSVQDAFGSSLATVTVRRRSEPVVRRLRPVVARTEQAIGRELVRLRRRAEAYHSTVKDPPGSAPLDHLLLTTLHRDVDVAGQLRYLADAGRRIDADLARITPPPARSLTVTARTSRLPLRITNGTDRQVTVLLRFGGRRLEVNEGHPKRVVLQPGANSITVPVLARTSGEFAVRVELRTANDDLLLGTTSIRVRSTVVSGVGVLLGGGALAFLVLWWGVTIRRDRRARRERDAAPPPPPEPASVA